MVSFRGARKVIAERMHSSLQTTAQLTYHCPLRVTRIVEQVSFWKREARSIGLQDCFLYALGRTLQAHPLLNGTCEENGYTLDATVSFSMALATPVGLMTPVIRDVAALGLQALAATRRSLTDAARDGRLKPSDMKGGSFTVSNLGLTNVEYFTPILNPPQIAIIGLGTMRQVVQLSTEGKLSANVVLPLSLTTDHRVVDGDPVGRFLLDLERTISDTDWPNA